MNTHISWTYDYTGVIYDEIKFVLHINDTDQVSTANTYYDYNGIVASVRIKAKYKDNSNVKSDDITSLFPIITDPSPGTEIVGDCGEDEIPPPPLSFSVSYKGFEHGDNLSIWIMNPLSEPDNYQYGSTTEPEGTILIDTQPDWTTPDFQVLIQNDYTLSSAWVDLTKRCLRCSDFCVEDPGDGYKYVCDGNDKCIKVQTCDVNTNPPQPYTKCTNQTHSYYYSSHPLCTDSVYKQYQIPNEDFPDYTYVNCHWDDNYWHCGDLSLEDDCANSWCSVYDGNYLRIHGIPLGCDGKQTGNTLPGSTYTKDCNYNCCKSKCDGNSKCSAFSFHPGQPNGSSHDYCYTWERNMTDGVTYGPTWYYQTTYIKQPDPYEHDLPDVVDDEAVVCDKSDDCKDVPGKPKCGSPKSGPRIYGLPEGTKVCVECMGSKECEGNPAGSKCNKDAGYVCAQCKDDKDCGNHEKCDDGFCL